MSNRLPSHAHPDHLKKQAKDLLRAQRSGELQAVARLQAHLTRLSTQTDVASAPISLQEAQFVVAREYGFSNWAELLDRVAPEMRSPTLQAVRAAHETLLPPLKAVLTRSLGREVDVVIAEISQLPISQFVQSLGPSCWDYCFKIDGRPGGHLAFSLPLCAALLDPQADGKQVSQRVDEILALSTDPAWKTNDRVWASNDDFRTIALIVKQLAEDIEDSWRMPRQNGMMDICLEMVPSLVDMERPTEPAVQVTIEVGSVGYEDLTISLCYVVSMVDLILSNVTEE